MRDVGFGLAFGAVLCAALAGCGGGSEAPDTGGGGLTLADFDAAFAEAQQEIPTSDMPTAGSAAYTGNIQLDVFDAESVQLAAVIGDLSLSVDFDQEQAQGQDGSVSTAPVTATISNLAGETVEGNPLIWEGDLTTAEGIAPSVVTIVTDSFPVPGFDPIVVRTGGLTANLGGAASLTSPELTFAGEAYVLMNGTFTGSGGTGIWGTAGVFIVPEGFGADETQAEVSATGGFVAAQ